MLHTCVDITLHLCIPYTGKELLYEHMLRRDAMPQQVLTISGQTQMQPGKRGGHVCYCCCRHQPKQTQQQ
jgi:hypothetical protein